MNIILDMTHPEQMTLRRLVALTRVYWRLSWASMDNPRSKFHHWIIILVVECERRKLDMDRVVRKP